VFAPRAATLPKRRASATDRRQMLAPTPRDSLVDAHGRPYFLWDSDMTLAELEAGLASADAEVSAYLAGKVLRQAKPDDALSFVSLATLDARWSEIARYLGDKREFWAWLLAQWKARRGGP